MLHTVTMRNETEDENGTVWAFEAVDKVPDDILESYVEDARTRWSHVEVS